MWHDHVKPKRSRDHVSWKENKFMTQDPDPYAVNPPSTPPPANIPPPANFPPPGGFPPVGYATPGEDGGYMGPPATKDDQNMAMLCYLLGILFMAGWIGPLIIWMTKKETSPFVNDQGKEALNWELTVLIVYVGCMATFCIPFVHFLGMLVIFAAGVTNLVL